MKAATLDLDVFAASAVLDQLAEGAIITDAAGSIRYVNDAARQMHGVAELDVEPEDYSDRYHLFTLDGEPHPVEQLPLVRAVGGETVIDAPWVIRKPDGEEVWALGSAKPLRDESERQIGAILTIRDVTETTRARNELRESEETVRAFFETAGIYTAVIDLRGDDFTLVMGNARLATVLGLPIIAGQSGRALMGGEKADQVIEWLAKGRGASEPVVFEYPWLGDNRTRWFAATITPMTNNPDRLFFASLEITDRKQTERDLARALDAKEALLHEVNHRVKNSLQIITALLQLQERTADEALAGHLREARSRVETVARVHQRLYDTSAHDRVEIVAYLQDLLVNVVDSIGPDSQRVEFKFDHSGARVDLGVEHSVPLALIVVEMAINAAKYAFPGGRHGTVTLATSTDADALTITISDDGVGLDASGESKGSGLGTRIVRALSAQLSADSAYIDGEAGTHFRLVMPLAGKALPSGD